jgi:hypothetical protein
MRGAWIIDYLGVSVNFRAVDGELDRRAFKKRDLGASGVGIGMSISSLILSRRTNGYAVNLWMVQIRISGRESGQEDEREEKSIRDERRFWPEILIGRWVEKDMVISRGVSDDGEDEVQSEEKREISSKFFHGRSRTQ